MKECFICKKLKEKGQYKYKIEPYTTIAITKGKNGKYRCFAWGEGEASIPCNYCPNCGNQLESIKEEYKKMIAAGIINTVKDELMQERNKEIEKKDKIIDLMAEHLIGIIFPDKENIEIIFDNKENVKQYFENKVKE